MTNVREATLEDFGNRRGEVVWRQVSSVLTCPICKRMCFDHKAQQIFDYLSGKEVPGPSVPGPPVRLGSTSPSVVEAVLVRYYAVYPNGRRCRVSMQDALQYGEQWKNVDDVRVITKLERQPCPVVGTLEQG